MFQLVPPNFLPTLPSPSRVLQDVPLDDQGNDGIMIPQDAVGARHRVLAGQILHDANHLQLR